MLKNKAMNPFLSDNIRFLRKRKNLTQQDLADAININRSTLNGYENRVSEPGIEDF